jgi:hypothetical protein
MQRSSLSRLVLGALLCLLAAGWLAPGQAAAADSDDIYGMNFPDEALADELRLPVARWGGNSTTRYNWRTTQCA